MIKLLLTAFEPFGGNSLNASQEVARALKDHRFEGAHIEVLELPVVRFLAPQLTVAALSRLRPDMVVMLGEAGGRAALTPERVAINIDDFPIPDNAGNWPREESSIAGGPAAYFSTLPVVAVRAALEKEGIAATISNTAGTYVCNHLFYHVMHHLSETSSSSLAGFLHIPVFPEQCSSAGENNPALSGAGILKGVQIAVETCITGASTLT